MLSVVPTAWELTSPQKAVFPQVFKFIASSEGMAAATFPSLLPFLSKVPVDVMGGQEKFLDRWFSALEEAVGTVRGSLELKAVVMAYLDCLFFMLNQDWLEPGVVEHLVKAHLLALLLRASTEPRMAAAGVAQLMAPYLLAWDKQGNPKAAAGLFWQELSNEALTRVDNSETKDAEALLGLLVSLRSPTGESPHHLNQLVEQLWHLLLEHLDSKDRADAACRRLEVLHEAVAPSPLESLLPDPKELADQLLLLLSSPSHQASACALLWTVTRQLQPPALAATLSKVTDSIPEATQLILTTVGKEAKNNAGVNLWLSSENMQEYVLQLLHAIRDPEYEDECLASLAALKTAGFQFNSGTLWQQLVASLTSLIPQDMTKVCKLLDVVEASADLWKGEIAAPLLLSLYKYSSEDAGLELQLQKTCLKGVGGGLEVKVAELVKGRLPEEEEEHERLLAKCLLILDGLEEQAKDGFLLAILPRQENEVQFGGRSAELLSHRNFCTSAPSTSQLGPPQLQRPWGALFFCRLLLHRLGLAVTDEEVGTTSSERSLEPIFLDQMGEMVLCIGYLTSLAGSPYCPASVTSLLSPLSLAVSSLLSGLDRESCSRVQHLMRGNALREGGLWAAGLAWLLEKMGANVEPLLPRVDTWTVGELDTAAALLSLAVKQGKGEAMVMQCLGVETARIVSMGGFINPMAIGSTWLVCRCIEFSKEEFMVEEVRAVLETLPAWRADNEDGLLYNCSLVGTSWEQALPVATVAKLLTSAINFCPSAISPALWDLASCSLVSWAASLEETGALLTQSPAASLMAVTVGKLGAALGAILGPIGHHPALSPSTVNTKAGDEELPPRLREEWAEFFSEGVFSSILQTFVSLSSESHTSSAIIQAELGAALVHCPAPVLIATTLPPLHMPQDVDSPPLPDSLTYLYNHLGPLLLSPCRNTQVSTAHLLASVAADLVASEAEGKDEEEERSLPLRLMEIVLRGGAALEGVLQEWKVGEPAPTIPPGCAAHTAAMGFLLSWRVILILISAAGQELRPRYSEFLRIGGHLGQLLEILFRLLPSSPVPSPDHFCPQLLPSSCPSSELEQLAGSVWVSVCRHLPALARHWWQDRDRQAAAAVERLTSAVVTPLLWREETKAIEAASASENMSLRVRDSVREVVATYSIDEGSMELVVSLPANHPLGGLTVESGKRVGVDTGQWRKWMLQLTTFLTHQNGTILDGLDLWRKNVDKRFEGVEVRPRATEVFLISIFQECYICFYILHGSNHQLPKLGCRTCKKKFHSACLYKWFSTSNNSSCPLCRNLF